MIFWFFFIVSFLFSFSGGIGYTGERALSERHQMVWSHPALPRRKAQSASCGCSEEQSLPKWSSLNISTLLNFILSCYVKQTLGSLHQFWRNPKSSGQVKQSWSFLFFSLYVKWVYYEQSFFVLALFKFSVSGYQDFTSWMKRVLLWSLEGN